MNIWHPTYKKGLFLIFPVDLFIGREVSCLSVAELHDLNAGQVFLQVLVQLGDGIPDGSIDPPGCLSKKVGNDSGW